MKCFTLVSWVLGSFVLLAVPSSGAPETESSKMTPALQEKLDKDDFVVTDTTYRQGFSAYLGGPHPAFITSDSILMAYTTLLEKVVGEQQLSLMGAQIELVVEMAQRMPEAANKAKGVKETRLFIGCAYRILIGVSLEGMTEEEGKLVELEARRVEKAEGDRPPKWWGARNYMPYSRFVPTSTWDTSEPMKRYFRYYQWMQSLPLDGANELHVKICEQMYQVIEGIDYECKNHALDPYYSGVGDDGVLHALDEVGYIDSERDPEKLSGEVLAILQGRSHFISPKSTPDKALIDEQLVKVGDLSRLTGSVGKALGNVLSWPDKEPSKQSKELSKKLRASAWDPDELYLSALMKLNETPDQRAPKLFHSEVWKRKQLNCTMGAWAEYRYAVAITQTTSASWLGMFRQDPGYVEPVPDFFQTLGTAAERLAGKSGGNQEQKERFRSHLFALELSQLANTIEALKTETDGRWYSSTSPSFRRHEGRLNQMFKKVVTEDKRDEWEVTEKWDLSYEGDRKELVTRIEASCKKFWAQVTDVKQLFARHATRTADDVSPRVYQLAILCLRLESLARKQLAGLERSEAELRLIKDYGKTLGYLMFYEGNSYLTPRDDAPKIVSIAHLGQPSGEHVLQCGTARPRQLLIRYSNRKGEPVLCQGAVYAYRERIAAKPISNREWREQSKKSSAPGWMAPVSDELPGE